MSLFDDFKNWLWSLGEWFGDVTISGLSSIFAHICEVLGYGGELIGALGIVVGLFMLRFRNTSILRWGFIIYGISFLVELIGITLR